MEFCPGNELYYLLNQAQKLTEEQAKFYVSEIVLALEHIHTSGIIYRDLKASACVFCFVCETLPAITPD